MLLNSFPSETAIPSRKIEHVDRIAAIISDFGLEDFFSIAYLHRHHEVPEGKVLLGKLVDEGVWTTARAISDIDLKRTHPHVLSVVVQTGSDGSQEIRILPSEFFDGPSQKHADIDPEFFKAFVAYICGNNLTSIIGLAVKHFDFGSMVEFSFPTGNLLIQKKEVKPNDNHLWLVTKWPVRSGAVAPEDGHVCAIVRDKDGNAIAHVKHEIKVNNSSEALKYLEQRDLLLEGEE
ncbi:hypothetical protein LEL_10539 [Akanthomyces lecanii RCEF 1005]|uniref:Uncharacterized protein n=1 Tax=Akanthomyces lecanii RCEF 1005 TaxID=1081108 RepID=A0A162J7Z3_CORDF|nr:hypothetical protein LEL_10539 [Akanthomyces lecanii RCEF 1005]